MSCENSCGRSPFVLDSPGPGFDAKVVSGLNRVSTPSGSEVDQPLTSRFDPVAIAPGTDTLSHQGRATIPFSGLRMVFLILFRSMIGNGPGPSKRIFPKQADRFIVGYELRVSPGVLFHTTGEEIDDVLS